MLLPLKTSTHTAHSKEDVDGKIVHTELLWCASYNKALAIIYHIDRHTNSF